MVKTNLLDTIRRPAVCKDFSQIAVINAVHSPLQILPTDLNVFHQVIVLFFLHHTTTTTILRPFFQDHLGEPVPEDNFWTLCCKGRLTVADTPTIRLGATPSGLTSAHLHHPQFFYRPDTLPAAQPTVSKHWRQLFFLQYLKNPSTKWKVYTKSMQRTVLLTQQLPQITKH